MNDNVTPINQEHKTIELEIKLMEADEGVFEGYGSIFGNKDSYGDIVEVGAFSDYLSKNKPKNVKLLWQHNPYEPIGVYEEVRQDEKGLYVKGRLLINDVARAREAYALMKNGAITGLSIGFTINKNGSEYVDNIRYLKSLSLWEISVVTFPANQRAVVSAVKDALKQPENIRDFESFLREVGGFSNNQAKYIALHGYTKGLQREAEEDDEQKLSRDVLCILSALKDGVNKL